MSDNTTGTPLEPYLIPDSPDGNQTLPVERLSPVAKMPPKEKKPKRAVKTGLPKPEKPAKFTLEEAFGYFAIPNPSEGLDLERAVRAVGFLLHWCSNAGNDEVNGWLIEGLGHVLDFTAGQFVYAFQSQNDELAKLRAAVSQLVQEKAENARAPK